MKTSYKVLWFEDRIQDLHNAPRVLENFLLEQGFILDKDLRTSINKQEVYDLSLELEGYNPYDLIIFDFDLGEQSEDGIQIAAELRNSIYTDMIFYSGSEPETLRTKLFENNIDGVFVVHKPQFINEAFPIIEDHIKKITDINNMRGVVMSAMSEVDIALREAIKVMCGENQELINKTVEDSKQRILSKLDERAKKVENVSDLDGLLDFTVSEFEIVRIALSKLTDNQAIKAALHQNGGFIYELQIERNKLAHQKDSFDDGELVLNKGSDKETTYNHEKFIELRQKLIRALQLCN